MELGIKKHVLVLWYRCTPPASLFVLWNLQFVPKCLFPTFLLYVSPPLSSRSLLISTVFLTCLRRWSSLLPQDVELSHSHVMDFLSIRSRKLFLYVTLLHIAAITFLVVNSAESKIPKPSAWWTFSPYAFSIPWANTARVRFGQHIWQACFLHLYYYVLASVWNSSSCYNE